MQLTLIRGTHTDHSDDTAIVIDRNGNRYHFPNISIPSDSLSGRSYLKGHAGLTAFTSQQPLPGSNTVEIHSDAGLPDTLIDANGNSIVSSTTTLSPGVGVAVSGPTLDTFGFQVPFAIGNTAQAGTTDYSGCVTSNTISSAFIFNFPGPDGRVSTIKACYGTLTLAPTFSQANVDPPSQTLPLNSYPNGGNTVILSAVMPDGNHWSFGYDAYGNVIRITLPSGGTITYQWAEITLPTCDGGLTQVSRAVSSRTVNDLSTSQAWHYTWGTLQSGSIINYVLDPNGNETAHVFSSPISGFPCSLQETETRSYQGLHTSGTLLKTVDNHYLGDLGTVALPNNGEFDFAADLRIDVVTTTLPGSKVSQIVRQYDSGPGSTSTFGKIINEKAYDYGSGAPGALLKETVTTYQWQLNSAYLDAGFLDLPASVIVKDGAGCKMSETDYAYDESAYPVISYTTNVGALPAGTHQSVITPRGNLTTVTHQIFDHSQCTPASQTAVNSHTKWYDTGVPYQSIDPLGHTTTFSYDPAYMVLTSHKPARRRLPASPTV